jgi:hypothetical protein
VRNTRAETLTGSSAPIVGISSLGDRLQRVRPRVVDQDRRHAGANSLRDLCKDCGRRILEGDGPAENLADRVEEIDLLVSFGELRRGVLYFKRSLSELGHDRHQQLDMPFFGRERWIARPDGEPDFFYRRNARH